MHGFVLELLVHRAFLLLLLVGALLTAIEMSSSQQILALVLSLNCWQCQFIFRKRLLCFVGILKELQQDVSLTQYFVFKFSSWDKQAHSCTCCCLLLEASSPDARPLSLARAGWQDVVRRLLCALGLAGCPSGSAAVFSVPVSLSQFLISLLRRNT